ncbi:MAG: VOC family protein [Clostridia bacterium]|nr:VOC family protein [Clostridia bacterium]
MKIGEVCLLTNDVKRLAAFYKRLLETENGSDDETHQFIIAEETALTIYNDGTAKNNRNQNICLAFTVDDIEKAYEKVLALGARIIEPPAKRPWGAVNMSFYDPDNNVIYFRSFPKNG